MDRKGVAHNGILFSRDKKNKNKQKNTFICNSMYNLELLLLLLSRFSHVRLCATP